MAVHDNDEPAADSRPGASSTGEFRYRFLDQLSQATRGLTEAWDVMATSARRLGEHLVATRCAYADVDANNDRFTIRNDWTLPGVPSSAGVYSLDLFGPQATSNLRNGRTLIVRDVDRELGDEGGGRMFNAIGIKAIICAGLVKEGRLVAMMAVHQAEPRDWTADEIGLVEEVVDRCWAHIERVRDAARLREQDRNKDEFLATLAHELRNPLAPVKYALAIMRRSDDATRIRHAQDVVDRQVTHMSRLIDDLLDVSRISRGLIQLQMEDVPLRAVIEQAVEAARPALEEGRHQLEVVLPDENLLVHGDAARLVQVASNLLTNAAKYTPDGGHIRVSAWAAGREAVIEVVDNGIGIPVEDQGRLFRMFTQLHHSASRAKGGLGIGLSLVKRLMEMHEGSVAVASDGLDAGSTFTVRMPLVMPAAQPAGVAGAGSHAAPGQGSLRVLVVEDNRDGRESLVALLEMMEYTVDAAADGREALVVAERFAPEVVLLDLGLPLIDGYEVCRRLRASPVTAESRIVALTGWGSEADRANTQAAGFDMHLTKPVDPAALEGWLGARVEEAKTAAAR